MCADIMWVYFYMGPKYKNVISKIQGEPMNPRWRYVILTYACMLLGFNVIVVPLIQNWTDVFRYASVLGFSIYSVYNGTCASVLANFDPIVALIDTLWGTSVYTIAGFFALLVVSIYKSS